MQEYQNFTRDRIEFRCCNMKTWYDYSYIVRKIVKFSCLWASETRVRPRFRRRPVEKGRDESSWDGNRISPLDPSTNPPRPIMSGKIEEKCRKDTRHRYSFLWTSLDPSENARYSFRLVNIRSHWRDTLSYNFWNFYTLMKSILGARDSWEIEISWFILLDI